MSKTAYCQHDAGVLENDKLSDGAREKFIKDVKEQLVLGDAGLPVFVMPCGPKLNPVPFADVIELEDETQYPDFHKNWLSTYEQIALALDFQSQFMFLPIVMDPLALAAKLQLDIPAFKFPDDFILYGVAVPLLALKLGFDIPVELIQKFPSILVPIPPIPKIPDINIDPTLFPDLYAHLAWPLKLPNLILSLITQMPNLFLGLLQFDFKPICDAVLGSGLFGNMSNSGNTIQVACAKVLARKVAECTLIAIVGGSVGSSSGGIVGAMGKEFGYFPPPPPETSTQNVRDRIVSAARKLDGKSWSSDKDIGSFTETLPYTEWILPTEAYNDKKSAFSKAKYYSSCGLFARGCYLRGGASGTYFTGDYVDSSAISGLVNAAQIKNALVPFSKNNMPSLKKGDSILVHTPGVPNSEHILVLTSDYSGGFTGSVDGIEGGQTDTRNDGKPTAIKTSTYRFFSRAGGIVAGKSESEGKSILKIIDAERITS